MDTALVFESHTPLRMSTIAVVYRCLLQYETYFLRLIDYDNIYKAYILSIYLGV